MNFGNSSLTTAAELRLPLVPVSQADEGNALADGRVAGDDEIALDVAGCGVDALELPRIAVGVLQRRPFRSEKDADDDAAVLDRRQFRLQRAEQQHVRPGNQRKGQHHQPAPRQRRRQQHGDSRASARSENFSTHR
jgi:hypothetical protein